MPPRRTPVSFVCKGCGDVITRDPAPARDNRREYCSRACKMQVWWRTHEKKLYTPSEAAVLRSKARELERAALRKATSCERQLEREIERAQRLQARSTCACGAKIHRPYGRVCDACASVNKSTGRRRSLGAGPGHLCPSCGRRFDSLETTVFCSSQCAKRYRHHGRYPSLGALPLDERNQIAELIALVRSAHRHLQHPSALSPADAGHTGGH
jgi:hypothetical protein